MGPRATGQGGSILATRIELAIRLDRLRRAEGSFAGHVLNHVPTSFLALVAFFGALFHMLVAGKLFTFFAASSTRIGTRPTDECSEGSTP